MDLFDEKTDALLAKYLAGECSPGEKAMLERWLAESPTHRKYLEESQWLWEHAARKDAPRHVDTEQALLRVKSRLPQRGSGLRWQRGFWMQAAAVLVLAVSAIYWWQQEKTPAPTQITAVESARSETLPDGSTVTLERASGLTLAPAFNRRERRMRLQGQAFFRVTHDTLRPFVVEAREIEVTVVGTAFTVDNSTDPNTVTVAVAAGKVRVSHKDQTLLLLPGEQATYDRRSGALTRTPDQGSPGGKSRMFLFKATPLRTVVQRVGEAYNARIVLKNKSLETCLLTARYDNLPLERVLEIIAESFSITWEKTESGYVLDGQGCGE